jgi:hypothetical protein
MLEPAIRDLARDKNFGPRAGFAYRALSGKNVFVVRGGYSLSYFNMDQNSFVSNMNNNTPLTATFSYNPLDAALAQSVIQGMGDLRRRNAFQILVRNA